METIFGTIDVKGNVEETIRLDINKLPSRDPLAFAYGINKGQWYIKQGTDHSKIDHGDKHSELAQEYLRGFLLGYRGLLIEEGTKIKKGQEQTMWFMTTDKVIGTVGSDGKIKLLI